jgi:hypothetical protein
MFGLRMRISVAGVVMVLAASTLFATASRADIIAAVGVDGPGPDGLDIALIDTTTGAHLGLPAGINTPSNELDPSITPDGKRLAFERFDNVTHVLHILVADLATGHQANLFNAFETGQYAPVAPTITPDGKTVITGAASQPSGGLFVPTWIETDISGFPNPPFPHTIRQQPNLAFPDQGTTLDPSFDPAAGVHGITALTLRRSHTPPIADGILVSDSGKNTNIFDSGGHSVDAPAYSSAAGVLLFERTGSAPGVIDIAYRTLTTNGTPQFTTFLVPGVNSSTGASFSPVFTADGRDIVYAHTESAAHPRLRVYDTETQTLLDPSGIDPGGIPFGRISVYQTFFLTSTNFLFTAGVPRVLFTLSAPSAVGILVQRIVGHHRLFGRLVPVLRKVGRVPFGSFRRGKHRVRWDLRVNGRELPRGSYLVTPRALTKTGAVRELGRPHIIRVR